MAQGLLHFILDIVGGCTMGLFIILSSLIMHSAICLGERSQNRARQFHKAKKVIPGPSDNSGIPGAKKSLIGSKRSQILSLGT